MRNFIIFLSFTINLNAATYYASVSGSGANNGTSQSNEWTFAQAVSNAVAGDIVYVRKGNYGNLQLTFSNSGTSGNKIQFIGYNTTPGDVVTTNRATFTRFESLNANTIPYFDSGLQSGQRASGKAMRVNGSYIHIENFAIRGFDEAVRSVGGNNSFKNINTDYTGDMRVDNIDGGFTYYLGISMSVLGGNTTVDNSFFRDADGQGFTIGSSNNVMNNIEVVSTPVTNTTDYQYLHQSGANNNQSYNISIIRVVGTKHLGHGICFKPTGGTAQGNLVDGFYLENSQIELQWTGTYNNIIRNGVIDGTTTQSANEFSSTSLNVINGAHDNLIMNVKMRNSFAMFNMSDWDDQQSEANGDGPQAGTNNTFINIAGYNIWVAAFYARFTNSGGSYGTIGHKFYNISIENSTRFIFSDMPHTGLEFRNVMIKNGGTFVETLNGTSINTNAIFDYFNYTGMTVNATPYNESNITNTAFNFADGANYDFTPSVNIVGGDFTGTFAEQGVDIDNAVRTVPFTSGAVEVGGTPPVGATCTDGIQNGTETGVDCGGSCAPCVVPPLDNVLSKKKQSGNLIIMN